MSLTFKRIKPSGIDYYIKNDGLTKQAADDYFSQAVADGAASGAVINLVLANPKNRQAKSKRSR